MKRLEIEDEAETQKRKEVEAAKSKEAFEAHREEMILHGEKRDLHNLEQQGVWGYAERLAISKNKLVSSRFLRRLPRHLLLD